MLMLGYLTLKMQWTVETMVNMLLLLLLRHLAKSIVVARLGYTIVKHRIPDVRRSVDVHVSLKRSIIDFLLSQRQMKNERKLNMCVCGKKKNISLSLYLCLTVYASFREVDTSLQRACVVGEILVDALCCRRS